jgi:hypothetical protein
MRAEEKFDIWRNGRRLANLLCATARKMPPDFGLAGRKGIHPNLPTLPRPL